MDGVEKLGVLAAPLEILEPHDEHPARVEAEEIDADGQRRGGVEPDLDFRVPVRVVADNGCPGDSKAFSLHAPDFLGAGNLFGLAFEFAEAAKKTERKLAGRRLGDDLVLLGRGFSSRPALPGR